MLHIWPSNDGLQYKPSMNYKMLLLFGFVGKTGFRVEQRSLVKLRLSSANIDKSSLGCWWWRLSCPERKQVTYTHAHTCLQHRASMHREHKDVNKAVCVCVCVCVCARARVSVCVFVRTFLFMMWMYMSVSTCLSLWMSLKVLQYNHEPQLLLLWSWKA